MGIALLPRGIALSISLAWALSVRRWSSVSRDHHAPPIERGFFGTPSLRKSRLFEGVVRARRMNRATFIFLFVRHLAWIVAAVGVWPRVGLRATHRA